MPRQVATKYTVLHASHMMPLWIGMGGDYGTITRLRTRKSRRGGTQLQFGPVRASMPRGLRVRGGIPNTAGNQVHGRPFRVIACHFGYAVETLCGGAQYERLLSNRFHRHGTNSGLAGLREYRPYGTAGVQPHLYCTSALAAKTWLGIRASAIMRHLYFGGKADTSHMCVRFIVKKSYAHFAHKGTEKVSTGETRHAMLGALLW